MTNITQTHLEAAIIDQIVAGTFPDQPYAFAAVYNDGAWQLGVAVANENGYNPLAKTFATRTEAECWADGLNEHIGRNVRDVFAIIGSTMRGTRVPILDRA